MESQFESVLELQMNIIPCLIFGALIFLLGNLQGQFISQRKEGRCINYFHSLNAALAGTIVGFAFYMILEFRDLTEILFYLTAVLLGVSLLSIVSGLLHLGIDKKSSRYKNGIFILGGLFNVDLKGSAFSNIIQILSRYSWELPQTILGYVFVQFLNSFGKVKEVKTLSGVTFCFYFQDSRLRQGVSIGLFIYIRTKQKEITFSSDPLLLHEYGHYLQSRKWGILYLFVIGIPSLLSSISAKPMSNGLSTHDLKWYEMQANRMAAEFLQHHFKVDWVQFEPPHGTFPRNKPKTFT